MTNPLVEPIKERLSLGHTKEEIKQEMIANGYSEEEFDHAFQAVKTTNSYTNSSTEKVFKKVLYTVKIGAGLLLGVILVWFVYTTSGDAIIEEREMVLETEETDVKDEISGAENLTEGSGNEVPYSKIGESRSLVVPFGNDISNSEEFSDGSFRDLSVLSPNNDTSVLVAGDQVQIQWIPIGIEQVDIHVLHLDDTGLIIDKTPIAAGITSSSFTWIPEVQEGAAYYRIEVSDTDSGIFAESDSFYIITQEQAEDIRNSEEFVNRTEDDQTRNTLVELMIQADIYFSSNKSFIGFCEDSATVKITDKFPDSTKATLSCNSNHDEWAVSIQRSDGTYACVGTEVSVDVAYSDSFKTSTSCI